MSESFIRDVANTGRGSVQEIQSYIATVLTQRTTVEPDTTAERLAVGIAYSVLNRLRDTSSLTARADELQQAYERGYLAAEAKYGEIASLRDVVDECLNRLAEAVAHLATPPEETA